MKLAIVGGRDYNNYENVKYHVLRYFNSERNSLFDEVISGGAGGADALAKQLAKEMNIKYTEFPADWETHGKAAGPIRNEQIMQYTDKVIAFWDGQSKGTMSAINLARKYKKDTIIIYV